MLRRHYSLILMALWLFIGLCLVAPELIVPEKARQHLRGGETVGILAFVFAAYNLARWWAIQSMFRNRQTTRAVNPLSVRKVEVEPQRKEYEHNPELDFFKPREESPGH
jgi:hypothetical protein